MYAVLVAQSCQTLCNPTDSSLPGSSVHAISQARILEWVAIPFSQDSFSPGINSGSLALQADASLSEPLWWWCSVTKSCPTLCPHGLQHTRLPFTISQSLLKLICIQSVMPSNHLIRKESDIFGAPRVQHEKAHSGCSRNVKLFSLHLPFPYCRLHDRGAAHKLLEGRLAHSGSTASNC